MRLLEDGGNRIPELIADDISKVVLMVCIIILI
jgi:hypothetical protein